MLLSPDREPVGIFLIRSVSSGFFCPTFDLSVLLSGLTAGLWFSVVNLVLKHAYGTFQTLSLESHYLETLKHILQ